MKNKSDHLLKYSADGDPSVHKRIPEKQVKGDPGDSGTKNERRRPEKEGGHPRNTGNIVYTGRG